MKNKTEKYVEQKFNAARKSFDTKIKKDEKAEEIRQERELEERAAIFQASNIDKFETLRQKQESKWRAAISARENRLKIEAELKLRKEEEKKRLQNLAAKIREDEENKERRQRELEQEKLEKAKELKIEKNKLRMLVKLSEENRKAEQKNWNYVIRSVRKMQIVVREENERKKEDAKAISEEKQRRIREEMRAKREEQKLQDKEWKRRMSAQVKLGIAKRKQKRKAEEPQVRLFMSRFRRLQIQIKRRKRKERLRVLRQEEQRLREKRQRHEQELLRRAEVAARLQKMHKMQQLCDARRDEQMKKIKREHEAEMTVYNAQKKEIAKIVDQLRYQSIKIRKHRERINKDKIEAEREVKKKREMQRRLAVSHALTKYRGRARALAERRAQELAEEELEWRQRKAQVAEYNRWVREQWALRALSLRCCEEQQKIAAQESEVKNKERKKEVEVRRREQVLRRIGRSRKVRKSGDTFCVGAEPRRSFLHMQRDEHSRKICYAATEKRKEAETTRKQARETRQAYIKDRELELRAVKTKNKQVVKKSQTKVWR